MARNSGDMSIIKMLESQVNLAESQGVSEQRSRNHRYYTMQPLGNEQPGRSQYVSPDVLDGVESAKSLFAETFFTGRNVVKFAPIAEGDSLEALKRTAYVNLQLDLNDWQSAFRDGWHDAFVAKRMVMHAGWKKQSEKLSVPIDNMTQEQLAMIIQIGSQKEIVVDIDSSGLEMAMDQATGVPMYSGELVVEVDRSQILLCLIQPERFFRDPYSTYAQTSSFCTWEMSKPRWELVEMGFDPAQVEGLKKQYRFRSTEEDTSRKAHDSSRSRGVNSSNTTSHDNVTVYRTCTWLTSGDLDGSGSVENPKLYEVWWGHGEILTWADGTPAVEEIDQMPFFEWTEYKISHAEHGMALADVLAQTQRVQSTLKRLILDNQQMRNTSRYEAVHGAIKNPRDLIDNRIGGIVWSRQIGSVAPLATPELSPLTLQAVELMSKDAEARSGMSALAKGMNADAVRYQNASNMVEKLTVAGNRRVMKAARDFATGFLIPLSKYIYRLGVKNDKRTYEMEVLGNFTTIAPSRWPDSEAPMKVQAALTKEECVAYGQSLLMMHNTMKEDPTLMLMYGVQQKHALLDDVFDALGVADTSRYMMRPDSPEYQQAAQAQAQQAQQQMQEAQAAQQASLQLAISDDKRKWEETQSRKMTEFDKAMDRKLDNLRQDMELEWKKIVDTRTLQIEEEKVDVKEKQAARPAPAAGGTPFAGRSAN